MSNEEQETFCAAHSDKLDQLIEVQAGQGSDIAWMVRIGKWTLYAVIGMITTIGPVCLGATWKIYSDHTDMQAKIMAGEKSDNEIKAWRDHLGERATRDHRECHSERGAL